jgi:hypothetical protein
VTSDGAGTIKSFNDAAFSMAAFHDALFFDASDDTHGAEL